MRIRIPALGITAALIFTPAAHAFDVTVDGRTCYLTATPGDHADVDKLRDAHEQQVMDRLRAVLPASTWDDLETLRVYAG